MNNHNSMAVNNNPIITTTNTTDTTSNNQPPAPRRVPSVTFAPFPEISQKPHLPSITRSRSSSHTSTLGNPVNHDYYSDNKRNHSLSVSSVNSVDSNNSSIYNQFDQFEKDDKNYFYPASKGKIRLMDDVDLENQLIITAGGKREHVMGFFCKLLFLMFIVFGSGVLIFYAL